MPSRSAALPPPMPAFRDRQVARADTTEPTAAGAVPDTVLLRSSGVTYTGAFGVTWNEVKDYQGNDLGAIPAEMGLSVEDFSGDFSLIEPTEEGIWVMSYSIQWPQDATARVQSEMYLTDWDYIESAHADLASLAHADERFRRTSACAIFQMSGDIGDGESVQLQWYRTGQTNSGLIYETADLKIVRLRAPA